MKKIIKQIIHWQYRWRSLKLNIIMLDARSRHFIFVTFNNNNIFYFNSRILWDNIQINIFELYERNTI